VSILLEALRKSEKSQQPHEVPGIHTDDQSGPVTESLRTGPLTLLLVVTLFVSGWFVWHQYQPPAGSYEPPVTLPVVSQQAGDEEIVQATPASPAADQAARQQRTPVESYQQTSSNILQPRPGSPSADNRPTITIADDGGSQTTPDTIASSKPVEPVTEKYRPQEPAPISYWELPDAVRANVPEIKFSVLVYARNPADRFVLINGQRLGEGDSSEPGLVVKEIRRDSVVFSYRLYQFLVER